jgi:hypothetical protein
MKLSKIGDCIAIPFFLLLALYFYKKKDKTDEEKILFLFSIGGLFADLYFVFLE